MGITLNDIAAQRAMLMRGEEKRKAARQAEERERLRDHFAAAALTGLLRSVPVDNVYYDDAVAKQAYASADAMLRERGNHSEKPNSSTNHDAAPAARAEDVLKEPNGSSTGEPGGEPESTIRTGNTPTLTDE